MYTFRLSSEQQLLEFVQKKLESEPETVVMIKDGKEIT